MPILAFLEIHLYAHKSSNLSIACCFFLKGITEKVSNKPKAPCKLTEDSCPVCKSPLEEYQYTKDGQQKTMLRCSNPKAKNDPKHKEAVYFHTTKGWWSPKFGELGTGK